MNAILMIIWRFGDGRNMLLGKLDVNFCRVMIGKWKLWERPMTSVRGSYIGWFMDHG